MEERGEVDCLGSQTEQSGSLVSRQRMPSTAGNSHGQRDASARALSQRIQSGENVVVGGSMGCCGSQTEILCTERRGDKAQGLCIKYPVV